MNDIDIKKPIIEIPIPDFSSDLRELAENITKGLSGSSKIQEYNNKMLSESQDSWTSFSDNLRKQLNQAFLIPSPFIEKLNSQIVLSDVLKEFSENLKPFNSLFSILDVPSSSFTSKISESILSICDLSLNSTNSLLEDLNIYSDAIDTIVERLKGTEINDEEIDGIINEFVNTDISIQNNKQVEIKELSSKQQYILGLIFKYIIAPFITIIFSHFVSSDSPIENSFFIENVNIVCENKDERQFTLSEDELLRVRELLELYDKYKESYQTETSE